MFYKKGFKLSGIARCATGGTTVVSRPCRVQRGAPLDCSSLGLTVQKSRPKIKPDLNLRCFWVTVAEPLRLEAQFNHRKVPKVLLICASLTVTVWN